VGLDGVVRTVSDDMRALAKEHGSVVRLDCDGPVDVTADPDYVRTIVENVLDNSLHSVRAQGGGSIHIWLGVEGGRATLRVSDNGPPLDAAIRDTVFEPLRTTKTQGLGLGLPIARALARAMRGDLVLEDIDGKVFRLELPLGGTP
jgi:signal transduction histidine kinase